MTKIVIDSNIGFSALLNTRSNIGRILIEGSHHYEFYAPEYFSAEILRYKEKIKSYAKIDEVEFKETYYLLFRELLIIDHVLIPKESYLKANALCKDIDIDDINFVALTDYIKGKLWTGDLKLINGLKKKGFLRVIGTNDLLEEFKRKSRK
jgi:predicted nucleic acid-binding protein